MEKLVEISFGDLKTIVNRRTVFFVFFLKITSEKTLGKTTPLPHKRKIENVFLNSLPK